MISKSDIDKESYKVGEVGKFVGLTSRTIQNYCSKGKIKETILPTGSRVILREDLINFLREIGYLYEDDNRIDIIYARVSTNKQKINGDLERQKNLIIKEIISKNPKNLEIFEEIGSGLNDNRKQLNKILDLVMENKVDRIFILHKDRLTRFGFNYLNTICKKFNTKIEIIIDEIQEKSIQEELAEDIISIIHSFSGKLYDLRNKIQKEVEKIDDFSRTN